MPKAAEAVPRPSGPADLGNPFYYLHNFNWLITWVGARYTALLSNDERQFIQRFPSIPKHSQAIFVRMVMRKGQLFRADKLNYREIADTPTALAALVNLGWLEPSPTLELDELFRLFTWSELKSILASHLTKHDLLGVRKRDAQAVLAQQQLPAATLAQWGSGAVTVYEMQLMPLCNRLRLMFFGNLHQDWSEFVLTELGTYSYEPVEFTEQSRPFHSRAEVDTYIELHACRERFYNDEPLIQVLQALPELPSANPWLVRSKDRLLFQLAREWERAGDLPQAQTLYSQCCHPGARGRRLRVLELMQRYAEALNLAEQALKLPESEAECQQLLRLLPRLQRKLGHGVRKRQKPAPVEQLELVLPYAPCVEQAVAEHLTTDQGPVFYVENTLLTGLFGLLCWDAVFAPLPGAFYHPFQRGPADLYWTDFFRRRETVFSKCLQRLDNATHGELILQNFYEKYGRQSPFLHWQVLTEELLNTALQCIPAAHLKACFMRLLQDVKANRAGLPDLIQFWPEQKTYRLIEVKGPGDRLQDNQRRWLDYFAEQQIPATVCYVHWQGTAGKLD